MAGTLLYFPLSNQRLPPLLSLQKHCPNSQSSGSPASPKRLKFAAKLASPLTARIIVVASMSQELSWREYLTLLTISLLSLTVCLGYIGDKERSAELSTQHTMGKAEFPSEGSKLKKLAHNSSKPFRIPLHVAEIGFKLMGSIPLILPRRRLQTLLAPKPECQPYRPSGR